MSKISSYWKTDCFGERVLVVEKRQGHISQAQLEDHLLHELIEPGIYVSIYNANESVGEIGWPAPEQSRGDRIYLYPYVPGEERCPVCQRMAVPNYCVKCGHYIDLAKDYDAPIVQIRGGIDKRRPLYILACSYATEGDCGVSGVGVSSSIDGLMRLMHEHVQEILYLDESDPFFKLPAPSPQELPATIEFEWGDARVRVEYVISTASVIL